MAHSISETWKREHVAARQLLEMLLAWAAVLAVAGVIFGGLYLGLSAFD